jgi:23S rRNA (uracil1939-C5)-methyltransferase
MSLVDLTIERPVAGGRMLARHDGQVVFVAGTIPGERVRARIERTQKHVAWATTVEVLEPSADRREPQGDPACGGRSYAHIAYARQCQLKGEVVADAFRRVGRLSLDAPPTIEASPESGYRLRARLHVRNGRAGFYREGTHLLCQAGVTSQMLPAATEAIDQLVSTLGPRAADCEAVIMAENVAATERVAHLEPREGARLDGLAGRIALPAGLTGATAGAGGRVVTLAGQPAVSDAAADLFRGDSPVGRLPVWTRRASSFFQGNRFLTGSLLKRVLDLTPGERIVDLYAGVGLFSIALAARGSDVVAVEGDRSSSGDLAANAAAWSERLHVMHASVEDATRHTPHETPDVVILDPPRTGVSPEALTGVASWRAPRLVYVSCDPPTLARDAARLIGAGYTLDSVDGFDLFPNTPHVETVASFSFRSA